jgi:low affinity Fe/Cu permease
LSASASKSSPRQLLDPAWNLPDIDPSGAGLVEEVYQLDFLALELKKLAGSTWAIGFALVVFLVWLDTLQQRDFNIHSFINDMTTMFTFMMVFILQRAQNRDTKAIHVKLDELIAAIEGASNRVIKAEEAPDHVLEEIHEATQNLARAVLDDSLHQGALSIENHIPASSRLMTAVVEEK